MKQRGEQEHRRLEEQRKRQQQEERWRGEEEEVAHKQVKEQEQNQLPREERKQLQDKQLAQEIEELIVIQYMQVEPKLLKQDVDLMSNTQHVAIQSPPPLTTNQAPSKDEEIIPLDEGPVMDTYNMTYNELKKKILQERKKYFPYDLTSIVIIKEMVIVINTRRKQCKL